VLNYHPATPDQIDEFLRLLHLEAGETLERAMQKMGMTWERFSSLAHSVGQVLCICREGIPVGYLWTEERGRVVHLHGLVVHPEHRCQGIGSQALAMLVERYAGEMDAIELGVHTSNLAARRLYERLGFIPVKHLPELGFDILQRPLAEKGAN